MSTIESQLRASNEQLRASNAALQSQATHDAARIAEAEQKSEALEKLVDSLKLRFDSLSADMAKAKAAVQRLSKIFAQQNKAKNAGNIKEAKKIEAEYKELQTKVRAQVKAATEGVMVLKGEAGEVEETVLVDEMDMMEV